MMASLKVANNPTADLPIKLFPEGPKVEQRKRKEARINADSVHPMVVTARREMIDQVDSRFLQAMPSVARLIQLYMSKQASMIALMPAEWVVTAKGFYLVWLRKAATALGASTRVSPPRPKKRSRTQHLFDGLEEPPSPVSPNDVGAGSDAVSLEASRWASLPQAKVDEFRDRSGMVNEFQLHFAVRKEFPLHFFVFRQTVVHIPHEANAETTFSLSGSLSCDNTHTGVDFLSHLTRIARNKKIYKPPALVVLKKYLQKFRMPGSGEDVMDLDDGKSEGSDSSGAEEGEGSEDEM